MGADENGDPPTEILAKIEVLWEIDELEAMAQKQNAPAMNYARIKKTKVEDPWPEFVRGGEPMPP